MPRGPVRPSASRTEELATCNYVRGFSQGLELTSAVGEFSRRRVSRMLDGACRLPESGPPDASRGSTWCRWKRPEPDEGPQLVCPGCRTRPGPRLTARRNPEPAQREWARSPPVQDPVPWAARNWGGLMAPFRACTAWRSRPSWSARTTWAMISSLPCFLGGGPPEPAAVVFIPPPPGVSGIPRPWTAQQPVELAVGQKPSGNRGPPPATNPPLRGAMSASRGLAILLQKATTARRSWAGAAGRLCAAAHAVRPEAARAPASREPPELSLTPVPLRTQVTQRRGPILADLDPVKQTRPGAGPCCATDRPSTGAPKMIPSARCAPLSGPLAAAMT